MILIGLLSLFSLFKNSVLQLRQGKSQLLLSLTKLAVCLLIVIANFSLSIFSSVSNIDDDRYEGNIYILYGGNGSLVPPRMDLPTS